MTDTIRDIIEAARSDAVWTRSGHKGFDITDGSNRTSDCDDILFVNDEREDWSGLGIDKDPYFIDPEAVAEFVVALQPEHALLMEEVCEVVNANGDRPLQEWIADLKAAKDALASYRREHGYTESQEISRK